jgi:hypothetical protein
MLDARPAMLAETIKALQLLGPDEQAKPLITELVDLITRAAPLAAPPPVGR